MNPFSRFGAFLNKFEHETTASLVLLFLFLLMFELFDVLSGSVILSLLPTMGAFISALLLFFAFRQSALANRQNKEKVTYRYYEESLRSIIDDSKKVHKLTLVHTLIKNPPIVRNEFTFAGCGGFIKFILESKIYESNYFRVEFDEVNHFINRYIEFYGRVRYDILKLVDENLLEENSTVLLKRYTKVLDNFVMVGYFTNEMEIDKTNMKYPLETLKHSHISFIKKIYQDVKPFLTT